MNRFVRMSYGYGGTKFQKILVSVPSPETAPTPLWRRLLLLAVWTVIPILVSLYALPTATQLATVIDISKLELNPPPEPPPPVSREPPRPKPVEKLPPPPPPPVQTTRKPLEKPPEVQVRPEINRPSAARVQDIQDYQPRIARERVRPGTDVAIPTSDTRIRRETAQSEAPTSKTSITRTRGAAAADAPAARERVAVLRRSPGTAGVLGGMDNGPRVITRRERTSAGPSGNGETASPRITALRGRARTSGTEDGEGSSAIGLVRGISLASLEICSSPQKEEDDIRAVLSVVSSRQSCMDEKGEFQFKATKRISSFNLMIFPAKGRKPTNRCEELENAYRCLKTH